MDFIRIYNEVALFKYEDEKDTPEERAWREKCREDIDRLRARGGSPLPISEL